jgi:hypothetical protein
MVTDRSVTRKNYHKSSRLGLPSLSIFCEIFSDDFVVTSSSLFELTLGCWREHVNLSDSPSFRFDDFVAFFSNSTFSYACVMSIPPVTPGTIVRS